MIMFMLGLIGEYIGRIYISLNNSPQFVIREIYGHTDEPEENRRKSIHKGIT
jgi:undecaprenyl-phosphate 4-deoxy-4-formamido-L-arabinose transferase